MTKKEAKAIIDAVKSDIARVFQIYLEEK